MASPFCRAMIRKSGLNQVVEPGLAAVHSFVSGYGSCPLPRSVEIPDDRSAHQLWCSCPRRDATPLKTCIRRWTWANKNLHASGLAVRGWRSSHLPIMDPGGGAGTPERPSTKCCNAGVSLCSEDGRALEARATRFLSYVKLMCRTRNGFRKDLGDGILVVRLIGMPGEFEDFLSEEGGIVDQWLHIRLMYWSPYEPTFICVEPTEGRLEVSPRRQARLLAEHPSLLQAVHGVRALPQIIDHFCEVVLPGRSSEADSRVQAATASRLDTARLSELAAVVAQAARASAQVEGPWSQTTRLESTSTTTRSSTIQRSSRWSSQRRQRTRTASPIFVLDQSAHGRIRGARSYSQLALMTQIRHALLTPLSRQTQLRRMLPH